MRFILLLLLKLFIILSNTAFADVSLRDDMSKQGKFLSKQFQFYGTMFQEINPEPLRKFCEFSKDTAKRYLSSKREMSDIDPNAAYHYGAIIGFSPCLEKNVKTAIHYLTKASDDGNSNAAYLLGLIFLKKNDIALAKKYFIKAARNFHPEASYNYAFIESHHFKYINQLTISLLKGAANSGNLKAQHDQSIVILKLFLNNKIKLKKSEVIRIYNVLHNVAKHSDDSALRTKAMKNLNNFISLTKKLVMTQNTQIINNNLPKDNNHIDFALLEKQAIEAFEDHMRFSDHIRY